MSFLYNKSKYKNQARQNQNNNSGTLPTNSFDSLAVEFYSNPIINSLNYSERPYLYTSNLYSNTYTLKGSMTIEASIGFPLFMIMVSFLLSIISVLYLQLSMQIALEETVRKSSKTAYISSLFLSLDEENQQNILDLEPSITRNIATSLISATYLQTSFNNEDNKKLINSPLIIDGEKGISFYSSSIDLDEGIADIVLNYKVKLPFLPEKLFNFNLTNRCYIHLYTGKELAKKQNPADSYVYFTSYGKVFHFNRYCQYLLNYTDAVSYKNIDPDIPGCSKCVKLSSEQLKEQNTIVYLTKSREFFHTSLDCPSFTGDVFRANYNSLNESDKICETCLKGK